MTLRAACQAIVTASQAPFRQLHIEATRLRGTALDVHDVWCELLTAAILAGVPARDAAVIIREALQGKPPTIEAHTPEALP